MARPSGKPARMQMVRKQPPAFAVLGMLAPMAEPERNANPMFVPVDPLDQLRANMVNEPLTTFVGSPETAERVNGNHGQRIYPWTARARRCFRPHRPLWR